MFRNQYDNDVTVWSPQGRLHQVEYAMQAVGLGSATVALKNRETAVLVALRRAASELSTSQRKIIPIHDHVGMSISGITADARVLSRYLRHECLSYKYSYDAQYPISRLVSNLGNKMQVTTQRYDRRPYGVGLLIAGCDELGPHIYQVLPSANFYDCKAMSIGARSQSARTYLERKLATLESLSYEELIINGILAIQSTISNDEKDKPVGISVAVVSIGKPFQVLTEEEVARYETIAKTYQKSNPGSSGGRPGDDDDQPSGDRPGDDGGDDGRPSVPDPGVAGPAVVQR